MTSLAERQSLAASLFAEKRYEEAERLLLELADERSAYSFLTLGYMSEMATIRPKNVKVAKYYYERAGLEGEPEGYVRLGCLLSDEGESASARTAFDKAERLLREQPDEGSFYASLTLGLKYQNGTNRPKDLEAAKGFYARAVRQGDPEACQRLGRLFFDECDWDRAQTVFETGASTGNVSNMYWLGRTLQERRAGPESDDRAIAWLERAAAGGHIYAERRLISIRAARSGSWVAHAMKIPKIAVLAARGVRLLLSDLHSDKLW